jgi:hypothetical protein
MSLCRPNRPIPSGESSPRRYRHVVVGGEPHTRCTGRSRADSTPDIHALVGANGLPILLTLTAGQAHDGHSAADMLAGPGDGQIRLADCG